MENDKDCNRDVAKTLIQKPMAWNDGRNDDGNDVNNAWVQMSISKPSRIHLAEARHQNCGSENVDQRQHADHDESVEFAEVFTADAFPHPRAMVVHALNAHSAKVAVLAATRLGQIALRAPFFGSPVLVGEGGGR